MKIYNKLFISSILVASVLLVGCEENAAPLAPKAAVATTQTSDNTPQAEQAPWVWPGTSKGAIALASDLTANNYMVVYDGSGSMGDPSCDKNSQTSKHAEGKIALKSFINAIPDESNIGFYAFDNNGKGVRTQLNTGNKSKIVAEIDSVSPGDGTPLKSAVRTGYDALTLQGQKQLGYGRYVLVIVTDGVASSGESPTNIVNDIIDDTPVEIHTVGFCLGDKHTLNQPGRTFYASATSSEEVLKSLEDVLSESSDVDDNDFSN